MTIKVDISKRQTEQLDAISLNRILKFAQALESHNGKALELRSANLLQQLVNQAKQNNTAELLELYQALKSSLRAQVKREPTSFAQMIVHNSKQTSGSISTQV